MLKQPAIFVLASFRPSTYHRGYASGLHSLRPCWTACLSILQEYLFLFQTCHHCFPRSANVLVPDVLDRLQFST